MPLLTCPSADRLTPATRRQSEAKDEAEGDNRPVGNQGVWRTKSTSTACGNRGAGLGLRGTYTKGPATPRGPGPSLLKRTPVTPQ